MPTKSGIDFSAIVADDYTFTARSGNTYPLRNDVPMATMAEAQYALATLFDIQSTVSGTESQHQLATFRAAFDGAQAAILAATGAIFRHSLPAVTDATLAKDFTMEEQVDIIRFFTTLVSQRFAPPPSATTPAKPATRRGKRSR